MSFDLDIVLAAHGAGDTSRANAIVERCAERLEVAMVGARVRPAFRLGTPSYTAAFQAADRPVRIVAPLLTSDGFHTAALRSVVERHTHHSQRSIVTDPLGTTPSIHEVIAAHVRERLRPSGILPAAVAVLVIGHGTPRHPNSRETTEGVVQALTAQLGCIARAAFLDDAPDIEHALRDLPPNAPLAIVPFLFGGGPHALVDVPARVEHECQALGRANAAIVLDPLSQLDILQAAIERTVRAAYSPHPVVRVGARGSDLSRRQVRLFAEQLAQRGADVSHVVIETSGDRDRITTDLPPGFFSDEIDEALLGGRVDVALHSAKDVTDASHPALEDIAVLARGRTDEVLVTRDGRSLERLLPGARVGTSSERRARQVRRLRPDISTVPIRGDVPARIAAVDRGEFDGVVLAAAGIERLGLTGRIAESFDVTGIVPAAGQGAIVVRCRRDAAQRELLHALDHPPTRREVQAERAFASLIERAGAATAAARAATVGAHLVLYGRGITNTGDVRDVVASDPDPDSVAADAARRWTHRARAREGS